MIYYHCRVRVPRRARRAVAAEGSLAEVHLDSVDAARLGEVWGIAVPREVLPEEPHGGEAGERTARHHLHMTKDMVSVIHQPMLPQCPP